MATPGTATRGGVEVAWNVSDVATEETRTRGSRLLDDNAWKGGCVGRQAVEGPLYGRVTDDYQI